MCPACPLGWACVVSLPSLRTSLSFARQRLQSSSGLREWWQLPAIYTVRPNPPGGRTWSLLFLSHFIIIFFSFWLLITQYIYVTLTALYVRFLKKTLLLLLLNRKVRSRMWTLLCVRWVLVRLVRGGSGCVGPSTHGSSPGWSAGSTRQSRSISQQW